MAERLSAMRWNRFHTVIVLLFGRGWAMDAFEVTLIGNVLGALRDRFHLGAAAMSLILGAWFAGLMFGATGFGCLADRHGRRRIFLASLVLYGLATLLTAFAPNLAALLALRLLAGVGVGTEFSAINAAIAELVPSGSRGRAAAIVLNFWPLGSLLAALLTLLTRYPARLSPATALITADAPDLVFGGCYSNLQATEALLAAAKRLGIPPARMICTGDVIAYGADPAATLDLIRNAGIATVMGNCEESLAVDAADCGCGFAPGSSCERLSAAWFAHAARHLGPEARLWMGALPPPAPPKVRRTPPFPSPASPRSGSTPARSATSPAPAATSKARR